MKKIWYGYLEEKGGEGTYVVYDSELMTPSNDLVYLFHYNRNEFILFRKDLVRPKLRSVRSHEFSIIDELDLAYRMAEFRFYMKKGHFLLDDIQIKNVTYTPVNYFTGETDAEKIEEVWEKFESLNRTGFD